MLQIRKTLPRQVRTPEMLVFDLTELCFFHDRLRINRREVGSHALSYLHSRMSLPCRRDKVQLLDKVEVEEWFGLYNY